MIWGSYDEPVNQAQLVHNLEHGGIAIQYGDDVPPATVEKLESFVQEQPARHRPRAVSRRSGTRSRSAPGSPRARRSRRRAPRTSRSARAFDEDAFQAFFDAYQFQGPERFPPDSLLPGSS